MNRILCISDIHGMYDKFCELLKVVKYNPSEDKLILLGDYCDRGQKSKEVIQMIHDLHNEWNIVAVKGNHDDMFLKFLFNDDYFSEANFLQNGGQQTLESYCGLDWFKTGGTYKEAKEFILKHYKHHVDFLNLLPYYHETDEFIFVHAGINSMYEDWKLTPPDEMIWIRDIFINNSTMTDKTVIFGHTPCVNLHETEDIWFGEDKIGIDGGCAYGLQLNCLEINDEDGYKTYAV